MTYIASPVHTICVGQAASMGSLLLCGGHPGQRLCLPHASVMVHQPSGGYFGQASDIAIHAREILRVRDQLNGIYRRHLTRKKKVVVGEGGEGDEGRMEGGEEGEKGYTIEEIERLMERDYFMSAREAVEVGVVDRVLERRERAPDESGDGKKKGGT